MISTGITIFDDDGLMIWESEYTNYQTVGTVIKNLITAYNKNSTEFYLI